MTIKTILYSLQVILAIWPALAEKAAREPVDTCIAARIRSRPAVEVRGTAALTKDGLVIADYTCPVAKSRTDRVGSMILVDVQSFSSNESRDRFRRLRIGGPLLQVIIKGHIQCKTKMEFVMSDDGEDIVRGTGFGNYGLIKCKVSGAELRLLKELK